MLQGFWGRFEAFRGGGDRVQAAFGQVSAERLEFGAVFGRDEGAEAPSRERREERCPELAVDAAESAATGL